MKYLVKNFLKIVLCVVLILTLLPLKVCEAKDMESATQTVGHISVGWNLGNTLNCCDGNRNWISNDINVTKEDHYEQLWGNPVTTKPMIDAVKAAGFNAIRIPVTYINHISQSGEIDKAWLDKVASNVQYALDNDMYVIINIHHETGYGNTKPVQANPKLLENSKIYLVSVWSQIAAYFKDYSDKLLFEGCNEALDMSAKNPWYGNTGSWEAMNILNQTFVDTVRATGSNNANRNLIINTYGAQITDGPLKYFRLPKDSVADHLIVGVHFFGGKASDIENVMKAVQGYILKDGIPVIVGEFGTEASKNLVYRTDSAYSYKQITKKYGVKCFWWDDGGNYRLLNRKNNTWVYPEIVYSLMQ